MFDMKKNLNITTFSILLSAFTMIITRKIFYFKLIFCPSFSNVLVATYGSFFYHLLYGDLMSDNIFFVNLKGTFKNIIKLRSCNDWANCKKNGRKNFKKM